MVHHGRSGSTWFSTGIIYYISLAASVGQYKAATIYHTLPAPLVEDWFWDEERKIWDHRNESGTSCKYYLELQAAPQPFELWVARSARSLTVECFPKVVAHHAAGQLIEGRGGDNFKDEVMVCFRLSDLLKGSKRS